MCTVIISLCNLMFVQCNQFNQLKFSFISGYTYIYISKILHEFQFIISILVKNIDNLFGGVLYYAYNLDTI